MIRLTHHPIPVHTLAWVLIAHTCTSSARSSSWLYKQTPHITLHLQVSQLHEETLHLLVLEDSTTDVILGRPWFVQHNPIISWKMGDVLKWGSRCFPDCFSQTPHPSWHHSETLTINSTSTESPLKKQSVEIPSCYATFSDVFCPKKVSQLPSHWPWDWAIDLIPDEPVPHGKIYPLSLPEQKAMEEYIEGITTSTLFSKINKLVKPPSSLLNGSSEICDDLTFFTHKINNIYQSPTW